MEMLEEEDPTKYEAHFSKFVAAGIDGGKLQDMYSEAHAKIKADPTFTPKDSKTVENKRVGNKITASGKTYQRNVKLTLKQRKEKVRQKIATAQKKALAAAAADDE